jgi:hypothetical protein
MAYIGERRDLTWLRLASYDVMRREQEDADYPGIPLDCPERREMSVVVQSLSPDDLSGIMFFFPLVSRDEVLRRWPQPTIWTGTLRSSLAALEEGATRCEREGRINSAARYLTGVARCQLALGEIAAADEAYARAVTFRDRVIAAAGETYARAVAFRDRLPVSSREALACGQYRLDRCMVVHGGQ